MRRFDTRTHTIDEIGLVFDQRLTEPSDSVEMDVRAIIADVRGRGDAAVLDFTRRWDFPNADSLRIPEAAIEAAADRVRRLEVWPALERASVRIREFHERQRRQSWFDSSRPGEVLGQIVRPLGRVGVYVPGGTAAYPSTVLMAGIPALTAGVSSVAIATPPSRETGLPPDATLAAAWLIGVREVYAMGGAQAIAALAFGTQSVPRVDKIVGPGNVFVNVAKRLVFGAVGIDMLAGPSEIAVLADESADPAAAAADIAAQCEHDVNCSAVIASPSESFISAVIRTLEEIGRDLPRGRIVREALARNGYAVWAKDLTEAAAVMNRYAPEHLHVVTSDPWSLLGLIENAGAILIGAHSSAPLGDYMAGPSHTLPTAGSARFSSPLSIDDFVKRTSLIHVNHAAGRELSADAAALAEFEGLEAHRRAAVIGAS